MSVRRTASHYPCQDQGEHVCQEPSGRACVDCGEPAGTWWGPYWCPECDQTRLDKASAGFAAIEAEFGR